VAIIAPIVSTFDKKGVQRASTSFGNFSRTVGRQLKNVAVAATGIGIALGAASLKAISAASDLDESISATRQIFGDASDAVLKFADDAALAFGQSKQEALDGALVFGTFGKAAGLAGDDLSDFTNGLLGLASDIASFRNATPEETIEAIGAALRGESEPLRRFGVLLDDATLKAEALELGIYDGNGALTQQQKILAAESAIFKQTADAQGDFARTSGGLANQQRILRARLDNVTAQLGVQLLPIALKVAGFFSDTFIPAVESLADTFAEKGLLGVLQSVWGFVKEYAPKIGQKFLEIAGATVSWIAENAGPAIARLGEWLSAIGEWITDVAYPYLAEKVLVWGRALWSWVSTDGLDTIRTLWSWLETLGGWLANTALPWLATKTANLAVALYSWIAPKAEKAIGQLWEWLNTLGTWFTETALPWLQTKINRLATALFNWVATDGAATIAALGKWMSSLGDWFANEAGPILERHAARLVDYIWSWVDGSRFDQETDAAAESAVNNFGEALVTKFVPGLLKLNAQIVQAIGLGLKGALEQAGRNLADDFVGAFTGGDGGLAKKLATSLTGLNAPQQAAGLFNWARGITGRASGGPVRGGTPYLVGEKGPELFLPGASGTIIPNHSMGGGAVYNITVNGAVDPVSTARQIRQILDQDARRQGRLSVV
jgi:hypothetical protein